MPRATAFSSAPMAGRCSCTTRRSPARAFARSSPARSSTTTSSKGRVDGSRCGLPSHAERHHLMACCFDRRGGPGRRRHGDIERVLVRVVVWALLHSFAARAFAVRPGSDVCEASAHDHKRCNQLPGRRFACSMARMRRCRTRPRPGQRDPTCAGAWWRSSVCDRLRRGASGDPSGQHAGATPVRRDG